MKIVTVQEMRRLEEACAAYGITTDDMMEKAGLAVAQEARRVLGTVAGKSILVLVGPGNNGGDGLVTARHLARWGASVTAYLVTQRPTEDPNLGLAMMEEADVISASSDGGYQRLGRELGRSQLAIDAVLGTGAARPLEGAVREVMLRLSARKGVLMALDSPTGVDADTGRADPASPKADLTVSLGFPKVGLLQFPATERVGRLEVADIGIPQELAGDITLELLTPSWVKARLPQRPSDSHKGTFGHALVIGGSLSYSGAAYLATQAALRSGPGLVTLATPQRIQAVLAAKLTEAIHLPVPDVDQGALGPWGVAAIRDNLSSYTSVALGCGVGHSRSTQQFVEYLLLTEPQLDQPLVVDADGLNNLSTIEGWWSRLKTPTVLTPHPGEMSRLTGVPTTEVQLCRTGMAREWAARWGKVVVLKGAYTVIANPEGMCWVSPFANPLLAIGGAGDVLTGLIGGLLAQGMGLEEAACCGVFLHGAAAERLRNTFGDRGATAGDLLEALPPVTQSIIEG